MYIIQRLIYSISRFFPKIYLAYVLAILCVSLVVLFIRYKYGKITLKERDKAFKKTKTYAIIVGILLAIYATLSIIPYISFEKDYYAVTDVVNYKDVYVKITDISYIDSYEKSNQYDPLTPDEGFVFIQIDVEINNTSDAKFYVNPTHWSLKAINQDTALKKKYSWSQINDSNPFDTDFVAPQEVATRTFIHSIPKNNSELELHYFETIETNINVKIKKAADFVIRLDEE